LAVDQEESWRAVRSLDQFIFDGQVVAEVEKSGSAAKALRAKFEEEAATALGTDDAAGAWPGFEDVSVDAGFAEVVSAGESGDSGADD